MSLLPTAHDQLLDVPPKLGGVHLASLSHCRYESVLRLPAYLFDLFCNGHNGISERIEFSTR